MTVADGITKSDLAIGDHDNDKIDLESAEPLPSLPLPPNSDNAEASNDILSQQDKRNTVAVTEENLDNINYLDPKQKPQLDTFSGLATTTPTTALFSDKIVNVIKDIIDEAEIAPQDQILIGDQIRAIVCQSLTDQGYSMPKTCPSFSQIEVQVQSQIQTGNVVTSNHVAQTGSELKRNIRPPVVVTKPPPELHFQDSTRQWLETPPLEIPFTQADFGRFNPQFVTGSSKPSTPEVTSGRAGSQNLIVGARRPPRRIDPYQPRIRSWPWQNNQQARPQNPTGYNNFSKVALLSK